MAAWQPSVPILECCVYVYPFLIGILEHGSRLDPWPITFPIMVRVGPRKNLVNCQFRKVSRISRVAVFCQQLGERCATWQATASLCLHFPQESNTHAANARRRSAVARISSQD